MRAERTYKAYVKEGVKMIKAIDEFLNQWEAKAIDYYLNAVDEYRAERYRIEHDSGYGSLGLENRLIIKRDLAKKYGAFTIELSDRGIDEDWLKVQMDREADRKRKDLISRITKTTGEIVNASGLHIGDNGSINGIVEGTDCKAMVETIMAGGYNIQCLHYRVLVHKFN